MHVYELPVVSFSHVEKCRAQFIYEYIRWTIAAKLQSRIRGRDYEGENTRFWVENTIIREVEVENKIRRGREYDKSRSRARGIVNSYSRVYILVVSTSRPLIS